MNYVADRYASSLNMLTSEACHLEPATSNLIYLDVGQASQKTKNAMSGDNFQNQRGDEPDHC